MIDAVDVPVTVKHRIGLDRNEDYGFVRDFVGAVSEAGCEVFIVHARNAWLKGLSPKENREVPPLRHEVVATLKRDFPALNFVVNGGLADAAAIGEAHDRFDGVMIGRAAYHDPWLLAMLDRSEARVQPGVQTHAASFVPPRTRADVVAAMVAYAEKQLGRGAQLRAIVRHMLGLYHAQPAARTWRRMLSDADLLRDADVSLLWKALEAVEQPAITMRATPQAALLRA